MFLQMHLDANKRSGISQDRSTLLSKLEVDELLLDVIEDASDVAPYRQSDTLASAGTSVA